MNQTFGFRHMHLDTEAIYLDTETIHLDKETINFDIDPCIWIHKPNILI